MILGIDTSLGTAVAAIDPDGVVHAEASSSNPLGHAEVIGSMLLEVTRDADLTHVAAGMGPGPFTGLRVGIAAARTFALGRGIPVVAVPSHDAAALAVLIGDAVRGVDTPPFAIVTDARRREFAFTRYTGLDDDGLPVAAGPAALTPRDNIDSVIKGFDRVDVETIPAAMVALVAARALAAGRTLTGPEPLYLRAPDISQPRGPKKVGL